MPLMQCPLRCADVHSLHHRNSDPEPFSGMSMHPVEHIYYLSCVSLSLYITASPFLVVWNLIHAVLAPAAGHSGYEDHWQSDQFHHIHHQYFECNYGNIGFPFDKWFGTIRHNIGDESDYKGEAAPVAALGESGDTQEVTEAQDTQGKTPAAKAAAKAAAKGHDPGLRYLRGSLTAEAVKTCKGKGACPSRLDHAAYWLFTASLPVVLYAAVFRVGPAASWKPEHVALFLSVGPVVMALLCGIMMRDSRSPRWPFHKEGIVGAFGWHLIMCVLTIVLPTYQCIEALLAERCAGATAGLVPLCW